MDRILLANVETGEIKMPASATPTETVERTFKPIQQFTRGWMLVESTNVCGVDLGFETGRQFWVVGRAGVLGCCPWQVAAGALAFHAPSHVEQAWAAIPEGLTPLDVSTEHYAGLIFAWGEETLAPVFDHDRLATIDGLGRRIANAAPLSVGGLFAGWSAVAQPDDIGARVALTTHLLRELRGAVHINAIIAAGLSPVDAILASTNAPPRTGPEWAERMGFEGPFRDPEEIRAARLRAEDTTAQVMEEYYSVLSPTELAEFGEVVDTTRNAIDM